MVLQASGCLLQKQTAHHLYHLQMQRSASISLPKLLPLQGRYAAKGGYLYSKPHSAHE